MRACFIYYSCADITLYYQVLRHLGTLDSFIHSNYQQEKEYVSHGIGLESVLLKSVLHNTVVSAQDLFWLGGWWLHTSFSCFANWLLDTLCFAFVSQQEIVSRGNFCIPPQYNIKSSYIRPHMLFFSFLYGLNSNRLKRLKQLLIALDNRCQLYGWSSFLEWSSLFSRSIYSNQIEKGQSDRERETEIERQW